MSPKILPDLTNEDPVLIKFKSDYLSVCDRQRKRKEIYGEDLHYWHFEAEKKRLSDLIYKRIQDNNRKVHTLFPEAEEQVVKDYLERRNQVFESNKNLPVVFNPPPKVYKDRDRTDLTAPVKSRSFRKRVRKHPADDPPVMDNAEKYRGNKTTDRTWRNYRKPRED